MAKVIVSDLIVNFLSMKSIFKYTASTHNFSNKIICTNTILNQSLITRTRSAMKMISDTSRTLIHLTGQGKGPCWSWCIYSKERVSESLDNAFQTNPYLRQSSVHQENQTWFFSKNDFKSMFISVTVKNQHFLLKGTNADFEFIGTGH